MVNDRKEIEDSIIGRLLVGSDQSVSSTNLSVESFSTSSNRVIFSTMEAIEKEGGKIDLMSVSSRIRDRHPEAKITNKELIGLTELANSYVQMPSLLRRLNDILRKESAISIAQEIELHAMSWDISNDTIFKMADKLLSTISSDSSKYDVGNNSLDDLDAYLEDRKGKTLFGYSFWEKFSMVDNCTKGIQKWRTYRIGAPSNLGKTQMAYNFINSLIKQGAKVAFFSLENDKNFTITNLMANHLGVNSHDIENWMVQPDYSYIESLADKLYIIDDTYELSEIFANCMEIKPDVVVLDYIGLVSIKRFSEDEKYTEYAKQVQRFVKKTRLSWIDLSNLPTGIDEEYMRFNGNFYWSSFLKNNADVGIHLMDYKPFYEWKKSMEDSPAHLNKIASDTSYKRRWNSVKGATVLISKNRIWPAKVEENYTINFNEGARFKVIEWEFKEKIVNLM